MKTYWKEFAIVALVFGLLWALGWQTYRLGQARNDYAALVNEFEGYKVAAQAEVNRINERHQEELRHVSTKAKEEQAQAVEEERRANALALNDNNRVYQREISRLRAACNTTTPTGSDDASDPIGVLAHVLTRTDEASGIYARVADERGIALSACIASYEAVREGDKPK